MTVTARRGPRTVTVTVTVVVDRAGSPLGAEVVAELGRRGATVTSWDHGDEVDVYVHLGPWSSPPPLAPLVDLDDDAFVAAFDAPVRELIDSLRAAYQRLRRPGGRVVVIVPTIGMAGAPGLAASAAAAEAQRLLVKSAARQWGADGVAMHLVAADLTALAPGVAGLPSVSLSAPALGDAAVRDLAGVARVVCMLATSDADLATGATLSADGGIWMAP